MSSLLAVNDRLKYHLYRKETDMRKSFDSLCGIVLNELGKRVIDGDAFIFINKHHTHLKLLIRGTNGFTILGHIPAKADNEKQHNWVDNTLTPVIEKAKKNECRLLNSVCKKTPHFLKNIYYYH
jgi:hypothetical protein